MIIVSQFGLRESVTNELWIQASRTDTIESSSAVLASSYTSSWDLLVDWGLLRPHAGYLRESLGYPSLRPVRADSQQVMESQELINSFSTVLLHRHGI